MCVCTIFQDESGRDRGGALTGFRHEKLTHDGRDGTMTSAAAQDRRKLFNLRHGAKETGTYCRFFIDISSTISSETKNYSVASRRVNTGKMI